MKVSSETKRLLEKIPKSILDFAYETVAFADQMAKNARVLTEEIDKMEVDDELST